VEFFYFSKIIHSFLFLSFFIHYAEKEIKEQQTAIDDAIKYDKIRLGTLEKMDEPIFDLAWLAKNSPVLCRYMSTCLTVHLQA